MYLHKYYKNINIYKTSFSDSPQNKKIAQKKLVKISTRKYHKIKLEKETM
jgi:hypothetical protein